ncbi:p450 monooxygenase [Moniliophthora roreri]|nr:p450 monooxygenase [Moniliophthora roreri]
MELFATFLLATFILLSLRLAGKHFSDPLKWSPGPKLAKWTRLYRFYYDSIVGGGWLRHLQELHEEYGPVVRVGYNELHFADPNAYADIYSSPTKLPKEPRLYATFELGLPPNVFSTVDPKEHSVMKSMLGSFFSRQGVLKLEHVIQERVDKLISQLVKNHKSTSANMNCAFRSVTLDVIILYVLRTNLDATSFPSFNHPAIHATDTANAQVYALRHTLWLGRTLNYLPRWLVLLLAPSSRPILEVKGQVEDLVDAALKDSHNPEYDPNSGPERNVFHTLISNARSEEMTTTRVTRDWLICTAGTLHVAGSDTVGNACTIGSRCLIRDDRVRTKLVQELETAWPDKESPMPLERLEKLPYLPAVVIWRVSPMQRVVPDSGAVIAGHSLPPGTIVSTANSFVHMNPDVFPEPESFCPERWLEDKDRTLDRYLVSFGKGPRSCLGINLAWCELYLIMGNVFRKLNLSSDSDLWSEVRFKEVFVPVYEGDVLSATAEERRS